VPKTNNFDLVRLAAALQVAFYHAITNLGVTEPAWPLRAMLDWFPGVPIFFFISGFLISRSFEKNSVLSEYARNRLLRIYPGLVACFALSLASVAMTGYFAKTTVPATQALLWAGAQLSVGQFYNPEFMRHYGVGVLNGSVWTITVELQFYMLVPLMYAVLAWQKRSRRSFNVLLVGLCLAFMCINLTYMHAAEFHTRPLWYRFVGVTFAPWFYMFLVGVLFQRNFEVIQRFLGGRFVLLFGVYCAAALMASAVLGWGFGNSLNPFLFAILSSTVFAAAFSAPTVSERILRRNDVSYGVYIYHEPVINYLLVTGIGATWFGLPLAVATTLVLSYASWCLVERPALGFKLHPLYRHRPAGFAS
jgi:peptidoglycan/LPS O-acetylase OafA/YrhL